MLNAKNLESKNVVKKQVNNPKAREAKDAHRNVDGKQLKSNKNSLKENNLNTRKAVQKTKKDLTNTKSSGKVGSKKSISKNTSLNNSGNNTKNKSNKKLKRRCKRSSRFSKIKNNSLSKNSITGKNKKSNKSNESSETGKPNARKNNANDRDKKISNSKNKKQI